MCVFLFVGGRLYLAAVGVRKLNTQHPERRHHALSSKDLHKGVLTPAVFVLGHRSGILSTSGNPWSSPCRLFRLLCFISRKTHALMRASLDHRTISNSKQQGTTRSYWLVARLFSYHIAYNTREVVYRVMLRLSSRTLEASTACRTVTNIPLSSNGFGMWNEIRSWSMGLEVGGFR